MTTDVARTGVAEAGQPYYRRSSQRTPLGAGSEGTVLGLDKGAIPAVILEALVVIVVGVPLLSSLSARTGAYGQTVGDQPTAAANEHSAPKRGSLAWARGAIHLPRHRSARTALLVGIDDAAGGTPLKGAVTDAQNGYAALLRYGFKSEDIGLLTNRYATRERILSQIRSLAARTTPDGIAVFMFAGHSGGSGGRLSLRAADGLRIAATELAQALAAVPARMWIALPTCNSGGYALPGIVGPDRLATFSSGAGELSYELGSTGSYLISHMVREAMLEGKAAGSVEDAFAYAEQTIAARYPDRVPWISDGVPGELLLGQPTG